MEVLAQSRGSSGSTGSNKRKSGDFEDLNDENAVNTSVLTRSTSGGSTQAKKAKVAEPVTPASKTPAGRTIAKNSALPRFAPGTRRTATTTSSAAAATSATSTAVTVSAQVAATPSASAASAAAVAVVPSTTPRRPAAGRGAQTPGRNAAASRVPNLESMIQEALSELAFSSIRGKLSGVFTSNNERMAAVANSLKMKTKSFDTKEKMKRQENAIKDLKELVSSVNEELQGALDSYEGVDKKLVALLTRTFTQRYDDMATIASLREKESELLRVKEAIAEERGTFKTSLLQMQIQYDEKIHRLETASMTQSQELLAKEKEILQLTHQLQSLKQDYDNAMRETSTHAEQRAEAITTKFAADLQALKDGLAAREQEVKHLQQERDDLLLQQRQRSEELMKLQMTMQSSDKLSNRQEEELAKMSAEIERLKAQILQKDDDLRQSMNSVREMQRQAAEEKGNFWTEFGTLNAKFQSCEDERKALFLQLAEKKEEVSLLQRDLTSLKASKQELEERLSALETEIVDSKEWKVQLEIEKKLRLKCEMHEETERRERTAAVAQLMAVQCESAKKVQEMEEMALAQKANLDKEIEMLATESNRLVAENKILSDTIAGLQKEVENLHLSLENASSNFQSLEEFSRATGEVEILRRRLEEVMKEKESSLSVSQSQLKDLQDKLHTSEVQRRKLHNVVQELRGNIRVFARVRPFLPNDGVDLNGQPATAIQVRPDLNSLQIQPPTSSSDTHRTEETLFNFDKVFGQSSSQDVIFDEVAEFVQSALDGYNVCLFSYGQTGSGKTHTMNGSGTGSMRGIIPRAMEQVGAYRRALQEKGWTYQMEVSFLEIYNETIRDLLRPDDEGTSSSTAESGKHDIKRDAQGNLFVSDLTKLLVDPDNANQLQSIMETAAQHRSVGCTKMNDRSSRSHAIFTLYLTAWNVSQGIQLNGSLNLVDLAGSERLDRSGVTGAALKETVAINKSLSSLADVFNALAKKQAHIPYRNSKLTHLLQPCLSGDGKTLMIVNLSPTEASYFESLSSLRFANQVNQCELGKPKRRLKDVAAAPAAAASSIPEKGCSTPSGMAASLTEPLSAKKPLLSASVSSLSSSLSRLDEMKEKQTNQGSGASTPVLASVVDKAALAKKRVVPAKSTTLSAKRPPIGKH